MDAATSATVTGTSKCLVEPSGNRMSGMGNSTPPTKSADEPHFFWTTDATAGRANSLLGQRVSGCVRGVITMLSLAGGGNALCLGSFPGKGPARKDANPYASAHCIRRQDVAQKFPNVRRDAKR